MALLDHEFSFLYCPSHFVLSDGLKFDLFLCNTKLTYKPLFSKTYYCILISIFTLYTFLLHLKEL